MRDNDKYSVELKYLFHTSKAVLVEGAMGKGDDAWLPLSQVDTDENLDMMPRGGSIALKAPLWLLEKYGLEDLV